MYEGPNAKGKTTITITREIAEEKWNRADSQKYA
jgi:hypothetical protein